MLFNSFPVPAWTDAWGGALAFGLQVYFDFSGYTDMAVGLALLFNVRLPENCSAATSSSGCSWGWRS